MGVGVSHHIRGHSTLSERGAQAATRPRPLGSHTALAHNGGQRRVWVYRTANLLGEHRYAL